MALTFSEGSIGGDIERVNLRELEAFYGGTRDARRWRSRDRESSCPSREPTGSNGIAIAPSNTANKHALLLINPHTSFFFRSEVQVSSDEGLNAYGAVDVGTVLRLSGIQRPRRLDAHVERRRQHRRVRRVDREEGRRLFYQYGKRAAPARRAEDHRAVQVARTAMAKKEFTVYRTHHGPIVRERGRQVDQRSAHAGAGEGAHAVVHAHEGDGATTSSRRSMDLHTNSSNNTIFADADGNIAYFHANFIPKRDPKFDWTKPVDGSNPATEWGELLSRRREPARAQPDERLALQHEQLAVLGGRAEQPEARGLSRRTWSAAARTRAACTRSACSKDRKDFTLGSLLERRVRQLSPAFDDARPAAVRRVRHDARGRSAQDEAGRADRRRCASGIIAGPATSVPTSLAVFWGERSVAPRARRRRARRCRRR